MSENTWPGPDDQLVVSQMRGNPDSPHWIQCYNWVSRLVDRSGIPEHLKEEVVQNAMISINRNLPDFRFESRLTTWLTKVVSSRKIDIFRRKKTHQVETSLDEPQDTAEDSEPFEARTRLTTEDECVLREELHGVLYELRKEVERCSKERDKIIIQMHFQDGLKYSEIAAKLGMKDNQMVAYVCNRTRRSLRKSCQHSPFE